MRALLAAALVLALSAATAHAQPLRCRQVEAYQGPALRPAPPASAFAPHQAATEPFAAETAARLEAVMARVIERLAPPTMTVAVMAPGRGVWTFDRGHEGALHYWASVGKVVTAAAVLQLAQEGRVSLSDPISAYVDDVPNGRLISLSMLMDHTSGLFSANEHNAFQAYPRRLPLAEELAIVRDHGPLFCPGANWRYSNTGYSLLGAVLERVEGRPLAEILTDRVVSRVTGGRVRVIAPDDALADFVPAAPTALGAGADPRIPGAAGPLAGDALGVLNLWRAMLSGEILPFETVQTQFERLYPMFESPTSYGLGVMRYDVPQADGSVAVWLGHSGGAPGVRAIVVYDVGQDAFAAIAATGDAPVEAIANGLFAALREPPA